MEEEKNDVNNDVKSAVKCDGKLHGRDDVNNNIKSYLNIDVEIVCASRIPPRHLSAGSRRPGGSDAWKLRNSEALIC